MQNPQWETILKVTMVKVLTFIVILQGFDLYLHVGYASRQLGVDVAVLHALVPAVHLAGGGRIISLLFHLEIWTFIIDQ